MKYFTLAELSNSSTATENKIKNLPTTQAKSNLNKLVDNVLDPLREKYGDVININSGFRSPKLNKLVGGVPTSQHILGMACDITTGSKEDNDKIFEIAKTLEFDQLIKYPTFIHVSYREGDNRKQIIRK